MSDRIRAGDPGYAATVQEAARRMGTQLRYHSIELNDGRVLPGLQPLKHLKRRLAVFGIPDDLSGKRVLDVGAWDGWFSFEMERRGAEVVATDCVPLRTFLEARALLGSKVVYLIRDVDELSAAELGRFDLVLFFGVLYHLRHPLQALERILTLTRDTALVESFVTTERGRAVLEFYETNELGGQLDNWFGPTPECLVALCRSAGFVQVALVDEEQQRASVVCRRRWPPPPESPDPAPLLQVVTNNRDFEARFRTSKDEYMGCCFLCRQPRLERNDVYVEVDGFGTPVLGLAQVGEEAWLANCIRPFGLEPGPHEVRVRTRASAPSNGMQILVDVEGARENEGVLTAAPPEIVAVVYSPPGDARYLDYGALDCYFKSEDACTISGVKALLDERPARVKSVLQLGYSWQAKIAVESGLRPGEHTVRLRTDRGGFSGRFSVVLELPEFDDFAARKEPGV